MKIIVSMLAGLLLMTTFAQASNGFNVGDSFVPPNCTVESWCLVKATECFVGYIEARRGYLGHSRYSVVRRAEVLCPTYPYGDVVRRTLTSPVEPVDFRSGTEMSESDAYTAAMDLCETYRNDWVSAAPICEN